MSMILLYHSILNLLLTTIPISYTLHQVQLRFELPRKNQRVGLPIGQHITFLAKGSDEKDIYRCAIRTWVMLSACQRRLSQVLCD